MATPLFFNRKPLPRSATEPMQTRRVVLLSLGHFANDTYHGFLAPLLPMLKAEIGFSLTLAALLTSIQAIFNSLSQPLFGHLADKMRNPAMAALGPLITALFLGTIGLWNSYAGLALILILAGLGTAAFHPQAAVLAARASGRSSATGMSIFVTGGSAGHALGPLIILPIVTGLGLEYSPITIIYGALVSVVLLRSLPRLERAPVHHVEPDLLSGLPKGRHRSLLVLWAVVTLRAFLIVALITFIPIFLHQRNTSLFLSGSAITVFEISGAAGAFCGGYLSDRFGRKLLILISFSASLPFLWLFLSLSGVLAFVSLALGGLILYSTIPVVIVMAQELFPNRANTVSSLMMGVAWGVGGLLVTPFGALADHVGVGPALNALLVVCPVAVFASLLLTEPRKEVPAEVEQNARSKKNA